LIIIIGLIILVATLVVGWQVHSATGAAHTRSPISSVFGYHVSGSAGTFLPGIVVWAARLLGLSLLRTATAPRLPAWQVREARAQAVARETHRPARERDDPIDQRDTAGADTASTPANGIAPRARLSADDDRWSRLRAFI
jgi:hypothetical protein